MATPRVDAHQHFWRFDPAEYAWIDDAMGRLRRDFLPGDLQPEIAAAGVDATIAVQVRQTLDETAWLLQLADAHSFIAGVIGWVDLRAPGVGDDLARLAQHPKFVGVRHIAQSEPDDRFLLRPDFCRGIGALEEFGLPYDVLIYPRHLPYAAELAARFERQHFVLDHLAKPEIRLGAIDHWARDLGRLAEHPNVSCKVSGLVTEAEWRRWRPEHIHPYLDVAFDCFGAERLIVGSDWPVCLVAASYAQPMAIVEDYMKNRPSAERDAVLGGNARRVWGLDGSSRNAHECQECS